MAASRRRQGELVRGVFEILSAEPEGLPAHEVLARLEETVPPTDYENSFYPRNPSVRRREKGVRFATISFVKAGWLRKEKGVWRVTPDGLEALARHPDPEAFARAAVQLYKEWKRTQPPTPELLDDDAGDEVPETASNLEEAEESASLEIREYLAAMNPYDFQDLVAALLGAMGYHVSYVSPRGPDQGVDIIAHNDPLGAEGPRIKVQVKRRKDRADVDSLRAFMAVLSVQDVGLFVNIGGFTSKAAEEARG